MSEEIFAWSVHDSYVNELKSQLPHWDGDAKKIFYADEFSGSRMNTEREHLLLGVHGAEDQYAEIRIPSIRALFRGTRKPGEFFDYPEDYIPFFSNIEEMIVHIVREGTVDRAMDDDFIEIYSTLRRRPDGRSVGILHNIIWRQVAFFLLTRECSPFEYESCIQKLERGVRKFHFNFSTHNYLDYLLEKF